MKKVFFVILIIFLLGGITYLFLLNYIAKRQEISNFEECAQAGYPVLESYPRQCKTPDGKTFVEELTSEEKEKLKLLYFLKMFRPHT